MRVALGMTTSYLCLLALGESEGGQLVAEQNPHPLETKGWGTPRFYAGRARALVSAFR